MKTKPRNYNKFVIATAAIVIIVLLIIAVVSSALGRPVSAIIKNYPLVTLIAKIILGFAYFTGLVIIIDYLQKASWPKKILYLILLFIYMFVIPLLLLVLV